MLEEIVFYLIYSRIRVHIVARKRVISSLKLKCFIVTVNRNYSSSVVSVKLLFFGQRN